MYFVIFWKRASLFEKNKRPRLIINNWIQPITNKWPRTIFNVMEKICWKRIITIVDTTICAEINSKKPFGFFLYSIIKIPAQKKLILWVSKRKSVCFSMLCLILYLAVLVAFFMFTFWILIYHYIHLWREIANSNSFTKFIGNAYR